MSWIHRALGATAIAACIVGCQASYGPRTDKMDPSPILVDEAMAQRQWPTSVAMYANGTSTGFPTLYPYEARTDTPQIEQVFTSPAIMFGQTLALPITMCITPPWQLTIYRGVYTPPTYTAIPVMPDDAKVLDTPSTWPINPRRQ